jgi:diguanylate cyclase (GGDEF)-like protein
MTQDEEIGLLKAEIEKLKSLAYKDELTRLYNRHGFKEESEKFLDEVEGYRKNPARRSSVLIKDFSLIIFDIDNFKKINDAYGHPAGDEALKMVSNIIMERVRDIDIVARWGGEEILVGLVGASEKDAFQVADDVRGKIEKTSLIWERKEIKFTISGGIASFDEENSEFDAMLKKADERLYKAKESGKNVIIKE